VLWRGDLLFGDLLIIMIAILTSFHPEMALFPLSCVLFPRRSLLRDGVEPGAVCFHVPVPFDKRGEVLTCTSRRKPLAAVQDYGRRACAAFPGEKIADF
jgi:hypothetical protein